MYRIHKEPTGFGLLSSVSSLPSPSSVSSNPRCTTSGPAEIDQGLSAGRQNIDRLFHPIL